MDSRTGELLAVADYPTFDANDPTSSPKADLGSRAMQDVYEPGSVETVLTVSSRMDLGLVTQPTKTVLPQQVGPEDRPRHAQFPDRKTRWQGQSVAGRVKSGG